MQNPDSDYPLLAKFAADEEEMPFSRQLAAVGGESGLYGGATLGAFLGYNNGGLNPYKHPKKFLTGRERARLATKNGLLGALAGNAIGFASGGGIGSLFDAHALRQQETEQRYQDWKAGVKENMNHRLEREASSSEQIAAGLYKTAGILRNIGTALGGKERKAKRAYNQLNNMDAFSSMPPTEYFAKLNQAQRNLSMEQTRREIAQKKLILPGLAVGGSAALGGAVALQQKSLNDRLLEELAQESAESGIDQAKRQGAGSVSNAIAGEDKTAYFSPPPLFSSIEKTAGPLNFLKNLTGTNVRKAQKNLNQINAVPTNRRERKRFTNDAAKTLSNARKDRNRARLGAGVAVTGGGAALGGYGAYKNSKLPEEANTMDDPFNEEQKLAYESIMNRLEKTSRFLLP